jgi:hypothetical protein
LRRGDCALCAKAAAHYPAEAGADTVAIQIPIVTAATPIIKLSPIFSPIVNSRNADNSEGNRITCALIDTTGVYHLQTP